MNPDLWLADPTIQIVSLTTNGVGGANEAEASYDIYSLNGSKLVPRAFVHPSFSPGT